MRIPIYPTLMMVLLPLSFPCDSVLAQSDIVAPEIIKNVQTKSQWIKGRNLELQGRNQLAAYSLQGDILRNELTQLMALENEGSDQVRAKHRKAVMRLTTKIDKLDGMEMAAQKLIDKGLALQLAALQSARERVATR